MSSSAIHSIYRSSLALLTDLYQLTMAHGYWKLGRQDEQAVFHLHFRKNPFKGGYSIACGLHDAIGWLEQFRFTEEDCAYLRTLKGNDGGPLFDPGFLDYLRTLEFSCDIDAIPEGTVVFPNEPLIRVRGPLLQCQLLETPLLNIVNFQTLIATKSARICQAARGEPVIEFGLRRAQGIDGSLSAARAAYVGGCVATSNVLAGRLFDIPVKGTHAHSWVMSFNSELESFEAYAKAMPNNCVFLVDTYNTLQGVKHAAKVGNELAKQNHKMVGIRLDSGDLAYLSIEARKILDEAGLPHAAILASNDLDEHIITALKDQGATINAWGVGTRLVTAHDQPALGGVYKLGALFNPSTRTWEPKVKLSEQIAKVSIPGVHQVKRFALDGQVRADLIYSETLQPDLSEIVDPYDPLRIRPIEPKAHGEDLVVPVFRAGKNVYAMPDIHRVRERTHKQLDSLHPTIRRFVNPHEYPVGLEKNLSAQRIELIKQARALKD